MLITCPSCASEYVIDPAHLRPSGRTVRCASCRTTFFAEPEPDPADDPFAFSVDVPEGAEAFAGDAYLGDPFAEPEPEPETVAPGPGDLVVDAKSRKSKKPKKGAAAAASDDGFEDPFAEPTGFEDTAAEALPARASGRSRGGDAPTGALPGFFARFAVPRVRIAPAPIALLVCASTLAYGLLARESVVRAAPELAAVYRLVGLDVNLRGLAIERVVSTRYEADGTRVLEVEGLVANVSDETLALPELAISLRDQTETSLYTWTVEPPQEELRAGESASFRARLVAPPLEARQVLVRFAPASRATLAQSGH